MYSTWRKTLVVGTLQAVALFLSFGAAHVMAQSRPLSLAYAASFDCSIIEYSNNNARTRVTGPLDFSFIDNGGPRYNQLVGTYSGETSLMLGGVATPVRLQGNLYASATHPVLYKRVFSLCSSELSLATIPAKNQAPKILSYTGAATATTPSTSLCQTSLRKGSSLTEHVGLAHLPSGEQVAMQCKISFKGI